MYSLFFCGAGEVSVYGSWCYIFPISRKLCQDPLEKFFGCQRQIGQTHEHPSVKEYGNNSDTLRVVQLCHYTTKGNEV